MSQVIRVSNSTRFAIELLYRFLSGEFGQKETIDDWKKFGVNYDAIELGDKGFRDHDFKVATRPITFTVARTPFFQVWIYHSSEFGPVAYEIHYRGITRFRDPDRVNENEWCSVDDPALHPVPEFRQLNAWKKIELEFPLMQFSPRSPTSK